MTDVREELDTYLADFAELDGAGPLAALRRQAFERFQALGFPSHKNEEWRFTSVAPLTKVPFRWAASKGYDEKLPRLLAGAEEGQRIVFVNGQHTPELSRHEPAIVRRL